MSNNVWETKTTQMTIQSGACVLHVGQVCYTCACTRTHPRTHPHTHSHKHAPTRAHTTRKEIRNAYWFSTATVVTPECYVIRTLRVLFWFRTMLQFSESGSKRKNEWIQIIICIIIQRLLDLLKNVWGHRFKPRAKYHCEIQGGSNMTGTNCDLFTHK